jgi:hypothetical protein
MSLANEYRQIAVTCQQEAEQSIGVHNQQQWLKLAEQWLKLVEAVEKFEAE